MSPADRDEQTQWDERLARSDAGELYGVHNLCDLGAGKRPGFNPACL